MSGSFLEEPVVSAEVQAQPDEGRARLLPPEVRQAVTYGRPVA
jgi:hypothetical protein